LLIARTIGVIRAICGLKNISRTTRPIEKMPDDAESIGDNDRW
jgi:hypothetical protein